MNNICLPIGLTINENKTINMLCITKSFDLHLERRILNKIYSNEIKSNSLKNLKPHKSNKTRKNY
jgi:hypothetical protein